jgi:hypothetical protein
MANVDAAKLAARNDAAMTTPLAALFFPSSSPAASLLATLAVFAIVFVARPFGSVLRHSTDAAARLLQGLSAGGEVSDAASFVAEAASRCRKASA